MDFSDRLPGCCTVFHGLRPLAGRPACDLLSLLESSDPVEAGVGLACANALANKAGEGFLDGDVLDCLDVGPEDHVGMVGHFGPLVGPLKERARSLTIFERVKEPCGDIRPAGEAEEALRRCQVALITATSIINHTIDGLLAAAGDCREVAILGASTPMLPESFSSTNATLLSGVVVENPGEILRVISEGGGMHLFKPYVRKVSLRVANDKATPRG
jgi:uncharacterized protein (DUF4213/DUF364 family)